ncbi:MAG: bifunctional diaminohydroxyphosphoribosylaminopyrimidine deaminase/5-amino-6-(5-phosphoribosylamino)uracil reductase RibD [Ketobacteraceae bacterium]|nr:bifunctional diaminohydroxyphosphoribosylaminopyrimidine deaminase/5-amino-6-(5-phosphoribosylamino)uracil reductase RibD [Ketobacteraceae bacterium]
MTGSLTNASFEPLQPQDGAFMARAIRLAWQGLYTCHPNPRVGCVLVKDGEIVGEGWHQIAGQGHAEVIALDQAGARAKGATAYVSLEPCSHFGKTPPCADALIKAGVGRVVSAIEDPNPRVGGTGHLKLLEAGIPVSCGLMEAEATAVNPGFIKRMKTGLPWVWMKTAMSVDGRTAMANGESQWITGPDARRDVQRLRARTEAIIMGVDTVMLDDPSYTVRPDSWQDSDACSHQWPEGFSPVQPLRVVLDSRLRMLPTANMLSLPGETWVVCATEDKGQKTELEAAGAKVLCFPNPDGLVDLEALLRHLGQADVNEVLVESGAVTAGAFVREGLVDEWWVYMAPSIMGCTARPVLDLHLHTMAEKRLLELKDMRQIGGDIRLRYQFQQIQQESA